MRRITFRILVAVSTFLIGISVTTVFIYKSGNSSKSAIEAQLAVNPNSVIQAVNSDSVILTITAQTFNPEGNNGILTGSGEYLELRIFASGRVETDDFEDRKPRRKVSSLEVGELRELINILNQPDLLSAKKKYPKFIMYTDCVVKQNITFVRDGREKTINVTNSDPSHPLNQKNYPTFLIRLIRMTNQIRNQIRSN